jgi:hypothetical protein
MDKLEWIGHQVRTDHGRVVKRIFESKLKGRKRMEKPRLRWLEDFEKDLRAMKDKRWRQKAVSVNKEAKDLREQQSQETSK